MRSIALFFWLLLLTLLGGVGPGRAQDILWARTYGGDHQDWAPAVEQTTDGGFIIAGCSDVPGGRNWDVTLLKTDLWGDTLWARTYDGGGSEWASCVRQTEDGGYILGVSDGLGDLLRVDETGEPIWSRDYPLIGMTARETKDGGFVVGGLQDGHAALLKTDPDGAEVWSHRYPALEWSEIHSLYEAEGGGFVLGGSAYSGLTAWDYYVVRTRPDGEVLWARTYGLRGFPDEGWAICPAPHGGSVLTGLYFGTLGLSADGDSLWLHYYGSGEISCAYSIDPTHDEGFVLGGIVDPGGIDDGDYLVARIDERGTAFWERSYGAGAGSFDNGQCIRQTDDHAYVMVGWSDAFGGGDMDVWLLRIDAELSATETRPTRAGDRGLRLPNPVTGGVPALLSYWMAEAGRAELEIYGPQGRMIYAASRTHARGGRYHMEWNPRGTSPGVYLIRLRGGADEQSGRLVLLR